MVTTKKQNKKLVERFPFLLPRNRFTDRVPDDYDYSYTELDSMPDGWRIAFGEKLCEEIREELVRTDYLEKYRIAQIKEKYGSLRWYDFGCTEKMLKEIIPKYEELSQKTCIRCGKPATVVTQGWIAPYCDDCNPEKEVEIRYDSISEDNDKSEEPEISEDEKWKRKCLELAAEIDQMREEKQP